MPPNNLIFLRPQEGGREQGGGHPGRPADTDQCCLTDILVISVLRVFLFVKKKKRLQLQMLEYMHTRARAHKHSQSSRSSGGLLSDSCAESRHLKSL